MIVGTPSKIVLVILISILGLAAEPTDALAGAAKSSLFLQGNSSFCRTIQGGPSARSRARSPHPAPGQLRRISASAVLPKTSARQRLPGGVGRDLLAPRSLRGPLARVPRFTSPPSKFSRPATPLANRSGANNLPNRIVAQARHYLGTPYRRGGSLEKGRATDCSGFVQFIYQKSNIDLPRSSSEQAREGRAVAYTMDFAKMRPGDLLFFGPRRHHVNHVGIYAGDGKMIHASSSSRRVVISDLHQPRLEGSFVVAKRLPEVQSPQSQGKPENRKMTADSKSPRPL
jgi:cell wall-associated NlpC family hydrolase